VIKVGCNDSLPKTWQWIKAQDYIDVRDGTHDSPKPVESGIPLVTSKNLVNGKIDFSTCTYITQHDHDAISKRSAVDDGDILYAMIGTIGNPVIVEKTFDFSIKNVALFKFNNDGVHNKYIFHFLNSDIAEQQFKSHSRGGTQKFVSLGNIRGLEIPLPPLPEQQRIAAILDKADAIRRKRQQAIQLADEFLRSVFLEMFGDPVTNPKGWEIKPVSTIANVTTGNTPPREDLNNYGSHIEWIKSDNINTPYHYLTTATEYLTEKGLSIGRSVNAGSILITCIAGSADCIGNVAISNRKVSFNQQINALTPKVESTTEYLYSLVLFGKRLIQSASTNSMKGMVSKGNLEKLLIPVPPVELQQKYSKQFTSYVKKSHRLKESLKYTDDLFNALSQQAFAGQL